MDDYRNRCQSYAPPFGRRAAFSGAYSHEDSNNRLPQDDPSTEDIEREFRHRIEKTFMPMKKENITDKILQTLTENRKRFENLCTYALNDHLIDLNNPDAVRSFETFLIKIEEAKDTLGRAIFYSLSS